jgi:hypothetical protein
MNWIETFPVFAVALGILMLIAAIRRVSNG